MSDHQHGELWDYIEGLREDLGRAEERIHALEQKAASLEGQTPQARQLEYEADVAAADLGESGYDRHGRDCRCSYCATDDDVPPSWLTRLDLPPRLARPYVQPGDPPEMIP